MEYARHTETSVVANAVPEVVFNFLDDQEALGAHMTERSAMMMGGRMTYEFDDAQGRALGAVIRMRGDILGLPLRVEEVVIERDPPWRKVVETRGRQQMFVIGAYRLGFEVQQEGVRSSVRVFIDYDLPKGPLRFLAGLLADAYARWCVASMAGAVSQRFGSSSTHDNDREPSNA